ncbi:unnamed protein product [Triticum turgidum subsp. durum]|uniref:Uncharacterized protein n=1 Tax=Triticum turgidum subsp. durum TaxID=4567 RepID=A0A9R0TC63_TRITD|nr:unnamed protein product [Triticum turgidum subsp. durum]
MINGQQGDDFINRMVVRFLAPFSRPPTPVGRLGLHPVDVFRWSMLFGEYQRFRVPEFDSDDTIRSAVELYQAGIRFKTSNSSSLHNIRFRRGVLSMPKLPVDDSTEYTLFNMVAFERLHVGTGSATGSAIMAYVFFVDVVLDPDGALSALLRELNGYSSLPWEMWFTNLKRTYFGSPWAFMSLLAAAFLLLMTVLQTVYTMRQFYRDG